jgi:uncharacterized delta-60 repeat protein
VRSSKVVAEASAAVVESLEGRALLSAGAVLTEAFTDFGSIDNGGAIFRLPDQKLLQVGLSFNAPGNEIALARFNPDGTPDAMFGDDIDGSNKTVASIPGHSIAAVNAITVKSGRIIVVGSAFGPTGSEFLIAAFTEDGALDLSFGPGGFTTSNLTGGPNEARAVAIGKDGEILVAGVHNQTFALTRYYDDGSLDTTFGTGGVAEISFAPGSNDQLRAMAIDASGKIVLAGSSQLAGETAPALGIQRYTAGGTPDTGFGDAGLVHYDILSPGVTEFGDRAYSLAIDSEGGILVGGATDGPTASFDDLFLLRLDSAGDPDTAFASGGIARANFGTFTSAIISDLAIQRDGSIIVGGSVAFCEDDECLSGSSNSFAIGRYSALGILDSTFGAGEGFALSQEFLGGTPDSNLTTIAIQTDAANNQFVALGSWLTRDFEDDLILLRLALSGAQVNLAGPTEAFEGDDVVFTASFPGLINGNIDFVQQQQRAEHSGTLISDSVDYVWTITLAGQSTPLATGAGTTSDEIDIAFTPADNGVYHIFVSVNGEASDEIFLTVANVAPTATIHGAPPSSLEGTPITLSSTVTDPGSADTFTYAWTVYKNDTSFLTGTLPTFTFTPDDDGNYVVTLRVTDDDGGVANAADPGTIAVGNVNPTATINGAPTSSLEGTPITLTSTVTDPGSADTHTYAWSVTKDGFAFDAGTSSTFTFTPDDDGNYVVTLRVTDDDGGVANAADPGTITVTNVDPTATIVGAPASSLEGTQITLTSTVTDPGSADTHTYAWSATKNGSAFESGTDSAFAFTIDDEGVYLITLTVTDDNGGSHTVGHTLNVDNVAPTATIVGAPSSSLEGSAITLTGTVTDPGTADTHTYAWSATKNGSPFASGSETTFTFTPDDDGSYAVTLTVTDNDGGVGSDARTIAINNVDPTATIEGAPASSLEGSAIALSSTVTDPGADTFTYAWSVTKNGSPFAEGTDSTFSFTPDDNGAYVVTLTVTDNDGGTGIASQNILITNVEPIVDPVFGPALGDQNINHTFTSTFTDPGSADTFTATWDFGDGTTLTTNPAAGDLSASHSYASAGTYTVTLTVTDDDGGSHSQSASITITSTPTGAVLQIYGNDANNSIIIDAGIDGAIVVYVDGVVSTHSGISQIIISARDGNDGVWVDGAVKQNVVVFGGPGHDLLRTGAGNDILVGGDGLDVMFGDKGRDILIGGDGTDILFGNADSDILVAGYSLYDSDADALTAILAEWTSHRSYGQRSANVLGQQVTVGGATYTLGGPRENGTTFLAPDGPSATVFDDGDIDILSGSSGQDLFLFNKGLLIFDIVTGQTAEELGVDIDLLS